MKKKYIYLFTVILSAFLSSCDNDFLERYPIDKETPPTVFTTYDNFKMYAWGLYNAKTTGDTKVDVGLKAYQNYPQSGDESDMLYWSNDAQGNSWVNDLYSPAKIAAYHWDFEYVRRVNVMLDNIEGSQLNEQEKEHWRGVGYFFRAHYYFEMLKKFGDLPWLEHVVETNDNEILYGKKDSREVIANNILSNLLYAEEKIKTDGDGKNTVNPNVVRAFISRFGLYEGTWRKYHGSVDGIDGAKYLQASIDASQKLINQDLGLISNYDDVFNSPSLANQKSILLYREYLENEADKGHDLTQRTQGEKLWEGTKRLVEHYLCSDGRPISTSTVYAGDNTVYDEFRNRDYRLYYTICPPYKVNVYEDPQTQKEVWDYTSNPVEREYIDLMNNLVTKAEGKKLPLTPKDVYLAYIPNITVASTKGIDTQTGYYMYKYYNKYPGYNSNERTGTDAPIFRMGEVLINHAEAMFELGRFDQSVADQTINKLRERAGVNKMTVSAIDASFDTYRDADVDPVLWEIRRERCVELMGSGFRFDDLKRWKKGYYMSDQPVGVKINDVSEYGNRAEEVAKILYNGSDIPRYKNCATYILKPNPGWLDKCYLYPIPLKQITLNPNLTQNPGWNN
jgi:SusD family.